MTPKTRFSTRDVHFGSKAVLTSPQAKKARKCKNEPKPSQTPQPLHPIKNPMKNSNSFVFDPHVTEDYLSDRHISPKSTAYPHCAVLNRREKFDIMKSYVHTINTILPQAP